VNELIKTVKKKEVRRQGRVLSAQRPMESTEFIKLIMRLQADTRPSHKYTLAAYFIFQYNLMARLDNVKNFKLEDLTPSLEYKYVLKSKMCRSKNVLEERDALDQILLGAMHKKLCVLVALAVHLEHGLMNGTLGSNGDGGAASSEEVTSLFGVEKHYVLTQLQQTLQAPGDFPNARPGLLGSHSICKFTATYARRNECSRDDVDTRGRWKSNKRMVDTYIDTSLLYPDVKVAETLCVGGAVKYALRRGSGISEQWILDHVSVHI
jgi:hypothetical protein